MTTIRCATLEDVPALIELGRRVHGETRFSEYDYNLTRVTENVTNIIKIGQNTRGTHCFFIAQDDQGEAAGVLIGVIERQLFSDLPVANVIVYYVFPNKRMSGAGFKLLSAFRKWADARSAFEICVGINSAAQIGRTHRFLMRVGFRQTGGNYSLQAKSERPALNRPAWGEEF